MWIEMGALVFPSRWLSSLSPLKACRETVKSVENIFLLNWRKMLAWSEFIEFGGRLGLRSIRIVARILRSMAIFQFIFRVCESLALQVFATFIQFYRNTGTCILALVHFTDEDGMTTMMHVCANVAARKTIMKNIPKQKSVTGRMENSRGVACAQQNPINKNNNNWDMCKCMDLLRFEWVMWNLLAITLVFNWMPTDADGCRWMPISNIHKYNKIIEKYFSALHVPHRFVDPAKISSQAAPCRRSSIDVRRELRQNLYISICIVRLSLLRKWNKTPKVAPFIAMCSSTVVSSIGERVCTCMATASATTVSGGGKCRNINYVSGSKPRART